jgi:hypothetical protein
MIWPEEYRSSYQPDWQCVFCEEGRASIVDEDTTARQLIKENGTSWILGKAAESIGFVNASVFNIVQQHGIEKLSMNWSSYHLANISSRLGLSHYTTPPS